MELLDFSLNRQFSKYGEDYIELLNKRLEVIADGDIYCRVTEYIKEKLNCILSDDQFIQAISEVLFFIHYSVLGYTVNYDVSTHSYNKKNIDLQIIENDLTLNFEVKCPSQDVIEEGKLHGKIANRHPNISKADFDRFFDQLAQMVYTTKNIKTQRLRTKDDTIVDCIRKASDQFNNKADNALNVLIIAADSERMGDFMWYMVNPSSGLFHSKCVADVDFSKIDYIAVTNIAAGHKINANFDFNVFDITNYVNIFFSPKKILPKTPVEYFFQNTFPNNNNEFYQFEIEHRNELQIADNGINDDEIIGLLAWKDYLAKKHPCFVQN